MRLTPHCRCCSGAQAPAPWPWPGRPVTLRSSRGGQHCRDALVQSVFIVAVPGPLGGVGGAPWAAKVTTVRTTVVDRTPLPARLQLVLPGGSRTNPKSMWFPSQVLTHPGRPVRPSIQAPGLTSEGFRLVSIAAFSPCSISERSAHDLQGGCSGLIVQEHDGNTASVQRDLRL